MTTSTSTHDFAARAYRQPLACTCGVEFASRVQLRRHIDRENAPAGAIVAGDVVQIGNGAARWLVVRLFGEGEALLARLSPVLEPGVERGTWERTRYQGGLVISKTAPVARLVRLDLVVR